ncbi:MAG TPA: hypothetical protein VK968_12135, partial [Roseimicrobium sp.]|nr:hypothetical protein [Roseimicrobium sp.]
GQQQLIQRFNDTLVGSQKENTLDRIVYGITSPYHVMTRVPAMGYGLGSGTLAGAFMLTGTKSFIGGENEWERVVYEMGGILGLAFILLRLSLAWKMLSGSVVAAWRGDTLPLLIFAAAVVPLAMGQWGVPMLQGYASLAAGLCFASIQLSRQEESLKRKDRTAARARRTPPSAMPRPDAFPR